MAGFKSIVSPSKTDIDVVIERSEQVLWGESMPLPHKRYRTYAVTNFRGGIGKSTLSFNLAYELARKYPCLLADACSQRNFSQNTFRDDLLDFKKTLYDALIVEMTNAGSFPYDDFVLSVKPHCTLFSGGKPCFMIPGSTHLFLFPSLFYSQFAQYAQLGGGEHTRAASARVLLSLQRIIEEAAKIAKPEKILIDMSPFLAEPRI